MMNINISRLMSKVELSQKMKDRKQGMQQWLPQHRLWLPQHQLWLPPHLSAVISLELRHLYAVGHLELCHLSAVESLKSQWSKVLNWLRSTMTSQTSDPGSSRASKNFTRFCQEILSWEKAKIICPVPPKNETLTSSPGLKSIIFSNNEYYYIY